MQFSDAGKLLLKQLEGLRTTAYLDQKGVWTIGYGHTGSEVKPDLVWTMDQCSNQFDVDLAVRIPTILRYLGGYALTDNQFAAIVILVFNIGTMAFGTSTVLQRIRRGDLIDVPSAIALWNKIEDKSGVFRVDPGLVKRRQAEIDLWNTP